MPSKKRKTYNIDQSPLFRLKARKKLAKILRVSLEKLKDISKGNDDDLYKEWDEPMPNGKMRHIEHPRFALRQVQERITNLLSRIAPPDYLYCPVKGRSYVNNAHRHVDGSVVRSLDIKKYFPSTTENRVSWFFHRRMQCSPDVARILTDVTTFKGRLPTGSSHSPIMSYFAHEDMWQAVNALAEQDGCLISIYIDDVTISGDNVSDKLIWDIKETIHGYGLRYHKEKDYRGGAKEITGVILREGKVLLPNRQHLKMHQTRRQIQAESDPEQRKKLANRLRGLKAQANQITSLNG